jgi:hypothetical protein
LKTQRKGRKQICTQSHPKNQNKLLQLSYNKTPKKRQSKQQAFNSTPPPPPKPTRNSASSIDDKNH